MYQYAEELGAIAEAFPPADLTDVAAARRRTDEMAQAREDDTDWTGVRLDASHAARSDGSPINIATYRPERQARPLPTLVFFHGGGFVLGDERSHDPLLTFLVRELCIAIVSVGYRLAPEHPCPAAVDDGATVLTWCGANAIANGFDVDRLAVGGQSAGATIAAGVALAARDADGPQISFLYLGEPVLDPRLTTTSMSTMDDTPVWSRRNAEVSWRHYLGGRNFDELPPHASPATCELIDHLPPTYIAANEIDPLRDEAIDFAQRLLDAGVPVELHVYRGAIHGLTVFDAPISQRARNDLIGELRRGLVDVGTARSSALADAQDHERGAP